MKDIDPEELIKAARDEREDEKQKAERQIKIDSVKAYLRRVTGKDHSAAVDKKAGLPKPTPEPQEEASGDDDDREDKWGEQ